MLQLYSVRHQRTPPYTPQANPVERANRIIKPMIAHFCDSNNRTWDIYLPSCLLVVDSSRPSGTGYSPAYLNFGREIQLPDNPRPYTPDGEVEQLPPEHLDYLEALKEAL